VVCARAGLARARRRPSGYRLNRAPSAQRHGEGCDHFGEFGSIAAKPASQREAAQVAAAGDGKVFHDSDGDALASAAKGVLGSGPATTTREQRTRVSLAPYVALSALFPLSFVLYRRNFA